MTGIGPGVSSSVSRPAQHSKPVVGTLSLGVDLAAEVTAFMRSEHVQHLVLAAHPVRAFLGIRREALLDRLVRGYPSGSFHVVSLP